MEDGKFIIASGTLPVTFNLDNMLKVGLIKLREGENMNQRDILEKLEPETLIDMIVDLQAALSRRVSSVTLATAYNNLFNDYENLQVDLAKITSELERLKQEHSGLVSIYLDTGPMLPKKGVTIRYTEPEDCDDI